MSYYIGRVYIDDRPKHRDGMAPAPTQTSKVLDGRRPQTETEILLHSELPENTRIIHPNSCYRAVYQYGRLNLHVDKKGQVVAQSVG